MGGAGDDWLFGGNGQNRLYGSTGDDVMDGGDDGIKDYLRGQEGKDKFQVDLVVTGDHASNIDLPLDFEDGLDSYYGS